MNYYCNQNPSDMMRVGEWERDKLAFFIYENGQEAAVILNVDQARHLRDSIHEWLQGGDI